MREAGQADVAELTGLMRAFYAESGFALDEQRAAAGFKTLLGDARLGRVWLIEQDPGPAVDEEPAAAADERTPPPAAGYIVVSFVFAMEYAGMAQSCDDFYVRPEARGEGLGKSALAEVRRACAWPSIYARPCRGRREQPRGPSRVPQRRLRAPAGPRRYGGTARAAGPQGVGEAPAAVPPPGAAPSLRSASPARAAFAAIASRTYAAIPGRIFS